MNNSFYGRAFSRIKILSVWRCYFAVPSDTHSIDTHTHTHGGTTHRSRMVHVAFLVKTNREKKTEKRNYQGGEKSSRKIESTKTKLSDLKRNCQNQNKQTDSRDAGRWYRRERWGATVAENKLRRRSKAKRAVKMEIKALLKIIPTNDFRYGGYHFGLLLSLPSVIPLIFFTFFHRPFIR